MRHSRNRLRTAPCTVQAEDVCANLCQRSAACRTDCRLLNIRFRCLAFAIPNDAHDFRNDIVGTPHPYLAADSNTLAADIAIVIKRRPLDRYTADIHRRQMRQRRELTRSSQLPCNLEQLRHGFLRRKFKSNRPAREFICRAKHLACTHIRDFDGCAVDEVIQRFSMCFHIVNRFQCFFDCFRRMHIWADIQAVFPEEIQHVILRFKALSFDITDLIKERIEVTARGNLRIQIAQSPCRGISRILQWFCCRFIVFFQLGKAHDALALNLHASLKRNGQRYGANGHCLWKNRFADFAIAARRRLNQPAAVISQIDRQSIELIFHAIGVFRQSAGFVGLLSASLRPRKDFLFTLRFVHAPQSGNMAVLLKAFHDRTAHAPRRRVFQTDACFFFQCTQLSVHRIPFVIGNIGFILIVVSARCLIQPVNEFAHTLLIVHLRHSSSLIIGAIASASSLIPTRTSSKRIMIRASDPLPLTRITAPRPNFLCMTWSPGA